VPRSYHETGNATDLYPLACRHRYNGDNSGIGGKTEGRDFYRSGTTSRCHVKPSVARLLCLFTLLSQSRHYARSHILGTSDCLFRMNQSFLSFPHFAVTKSPLRLERHGVEGACDHIERSGMPLVSRSVCCSGHCIAVQLLTPQNLLSQTLASSECLPES